MSDGPDGLMRALRALTLTCPFVCCRYPVAIPSLIPAGRPADGPGGPDHMEVRHMLWTYAITFIFGMLAGGLLGIKAEKRG